MTGAEGLVPPHDAVAEASVLGGMLLSRDAAFEVISVLEARDHYLPKHELVHEAIVALLGRGEPADAVTVVDELRRRGVLERVGGAAFPHELTSAVPTAANAVFYAEIVREKAILRRLVEAGIRITQRGYASEGDAAELAESARRELDEAAANAVAQVEPIGSAFSRLVDSLEERPRYVETPWRDLNALVGGLRPGGLYVIGARPGEGKTIMGLQLAAQLASSGPVAFSSLEMSRDELLTRLIAMRGKVHLTPLTTHALSDEDWERVSRVRPGILNLPLFVDDRSGVTVTQIRAWARSVSRRGQLAGVVVDYLQLITGGDRSRARHEVVGEISRQLKILARELGCPVLALSQLNRESVGKQGRRAPSLADLRESGSIEQDADVVLLLQRSLDDDGKPGDRLGVHVAKNRHGQTGVRTLAWEGQFARVVDLRWAFGQPVSGE